jgi:hypothetical protein
VTKLDAFLWGMAALILGLTLTGPASGFVLLGAALMLLLVVV